MGAVLRIHYFDQSTDEVHLACEHPHTYWTWYVSEDGRWLITRRFERGMERTQVPMANIKALVVMQCERSTAAAAPPPEGDTAKCACEGYWLPPGESFLEAEGRTHRSKALGDVICDRVPHG